MKTGKKRKTKRKQRGRGIDIQKVLSKFGELHWPGCQYLGPGTKLKQRLARGDPGRNRLDRIAKQHDIDYSKAKVIQDKWKADAKMIKAIDRLPGKKTWTEAIVKKNNTSKKNDLKCNLIHILKGCYSIFVFYINIAQVSIHALSKHFRLSVPCDLVFSSFAATVHRVNLTTFQEMVAVYPHRYFLLFGVSFYNDPHYP